MRIQHKLKKTANILQNFFINVSRLLMKGGRSQTYEFKKKGEQNG